MCTPSARACDGLLYYVYVDLSAASQGKEEPSNLNLHRTALIHDALVHVAVIMTLPALNRNKANRENDDRLIPAIEVLH